MKFVMKFNLSFLSLEKYNFSSLTIEKVGNEIYTKYLNGKSNAYTILFFFFYANFNSRKEKPIFFCFNEKYEPFGIKPTTTKYFQSEKLLFLGAKEKLFYSSKYFYAFHSVSAHSSTLSHTQIIQLNEMETCWCWWYSFFFFYNSTVLGSSTIFFYFLHLFTLRSLDGIALFIKWNYS